MKNFCSIPRNVKVGNLARHKSMLSEHDDLCVSHNEKFLTTKRNYKDRENKKSILGIPNPMLMFSVSLQPTLLDNT